MRTSIIKVLTIMLIFVVVQAHAADDYFSQYSGCPGYLRVDPLLDKMELYFTNYGTQLCWLTASGGLRWTMTPTRDGAWYASVTLKVEKNLLVFVYAPDVYSIKWKLRVYDAATRRVVSEVYGPECSFGVPNLAWKCVVGDPLFGQVVYRGLSLEGFTYTMTAWFTGVRGGKYYAEVVMDVKAGPVPPGFSSHKLVGYYFTYGYAGFPRSPEE